jgi:hypothetical protein
MAIAHDGFAGAVKWPWMFTLLARVVGPTGVHSIDRVGSLVRRSLALRGPFTKSGGDVRPRMAVQNNRAHEREAQAHDRSADRYEQHARLLDRYGAHRSAGTERRHAEDERELAEATRRSKTRG